MTIGEDNHADDDVDNNSGVVAWTCIDETIQSDCSDYLALERVKIGTYGFADFLYRIATWRVPIEAT